MLRPALAIAAILVVAPLSYPDVIAVFGPLVLDFAWFSVESITKLQLLAVAIFLPIVFATKAYEWVKKRIT